MTETMDLYQTRVEELGRSFGPHTETDGTGDYHRHLTGQLTDHMLELGRTAGRIGPGPRPAVV
jgi:hypothetical protein